MEDVDSRTYKKRGELKEAMRVFRVDKEIICDSGVLM